MTHRPMRRGDRAASREASLAVLDSAPFVTVATIDDAGAPYCVPLSFVRRGDALYFHAAKEGGLKAECFRRDARACATAVMDVQAFFDGGDFSASYRSAIAFGRMREVDDPAEFKHALVDLCMKYLPAHKHDIGRAMQAEGPHTTVWALDIDELTGKARSLPADGNAAARSLPADESAVARTSASENACADAPKTEQPCA